MIDTFLFSPTLRKIGIGDDYKFFRSDSWTTNGFWAIKFIYEPKNLKVLKNKEGGPDEKVLNITVREAQRDMLEVEPINSLRVTGKNIIVQFQKAGVFGKLDAFKSFMNVYYLSFVKRALAKKYIGFKIYQRAEDTPFVFKSGEDVLALVMPVRQTD